MYFKHDWANIWWFSTMTPFPSITPFNGANCTLAITADSTNIKTRTDYTITITTDFFFVRRITLKAINASLFQNVDCIEAVGSEI